MRNAKRMSIPTLATILALAFGMLFPCSALAENGSPDDNVGSETAQAEAPDAQGAADGSTDDPAGGESGSDTDGGDETDGASVTSDGGEDVNDANATDRSDSPDEATTADEASKTAKSDKDSSRETAVELEGETNNVDPTQRADNSFIYDTTIDSLFSQPSLYEGRTVQVVGEAIGDIVAETPLNKKRCWVTLTAIDVNSPATISVVISTSQKKQIDHLGRYGVTGTILQVRGTYHQACPDHEGIADIHVTTVEAIERGIEHPDLFDLNDFVPGIFTVCLGLILITAYYIVRERTR